MMKKRIRVSQKECKVWRHSARDHEQAQRVRRRVAKMKLTIVGLRRAIQRVNVVRTDTTLDLSQKATIERERG